MFTQKAMFKLFTKKSKHVPEVSVVEPVQPPMPNLATMLILAMTSYIGQNEKLSGQVVPSIKEVRTAYDRLLKLGMGQTQNARALQIQIEANNKAINDYWMAKAIVRFIKEAQEHFGPRTVLVSYAAFNDLCERYGLVQGALDDFCGVIPERNVCDIENVMAKIPTFISKDCLNTNNDMYGRDYLYITGADLHSDNADLAGYIKERHNILKLKTDMNKYRSCWYPADIVGYYCGSYGHLSKLYGVIIKPTTLFIACPKQFLKNPDIKIQPKPVDPAVFQFTPYGILVHTIWGEEAEDAAFEEFMNLNLRIANS